MRTPPFGIGAWGNPKLAAQLAYEDGIVSHAGDGVYAGQAVAAAVAAASAIDTGQDLRWMEVVKAALSVIPEDSWTYRSITRAVEIGSRYDTVWDALEPLYTEIVCDYYFWSDLAPEAVGLAFGLMAAARGSFYHSVLGGVNIGRDTDTIAAIAGAITGALWGVEQIPEKWAGRIQKVNGICIKVVEGMHVLDTADALVRRES